jgi:hypothetical protein
MLKRAFRSLLLIIIAGLLIMGERTRYRNYTQGITLRPLLFDADNPRHVRQGALTFQKAWELLSPHSDFGGISGLRALPGGRFLGISDAGALIGFGLTTDDKVDRPFIAALPGAIGPKVDYDERDSEGMAYDPTSKRFWISYEGKHAIRRFTPSLSRTDGIVRPKEMKDWPSNGGAEAFLRLSDGRFILLAENADGPNDTKQALIFSGDPIEPGTAISKFTYRPPAGYRPTDATQLPNGQILILNRRLSFPSGLTAKIVLADASAIESGVILQGTEIATLESPVLVDNMEGITATMEGDKLIIWIISDNNFNIWQRTILMKFAITLPTKKPEVITPGFDTLSSPN